MPPRPAIFLDRDGTLIEDVGYLSRVDQVKLLPGAADALCRFNEMGWPVILITNQSGVGRGYFPESRVHEVHEHLIRILHHHNAILDAIYYCPHHPDAGCDCRKPKPGMLMQAARDHHLDLSQSWMIGDKDDDVRAGLAAGCRAAKISSPSGLSDRATAILRRAA